MGIPVEILRTTVEGTNGSTFALPMRQSFGVLQVTFADSPGGVYRVLLQLSNDNVVWNDFFLTDNFTDHNDKVFSMFFQMNMKFVRAVMTANNDSNEVAVTLIAKPYSLTN